MWQNTGLHQSPRQQQSVTCRESLFNCSQLKHSSTSSAWAGPTRCVGLLRWVGTRPWRTCGSGHGSVGMVLPFPPCRLPVLMHTPCSRLSWLLRVSTGSGSLPWTLCLAAAPLPASHNTWRSYRGLGFRVPKHFPSWIQSCRAGATPVNSFVSIW